MIPGVRPLVLLGVLLAAGGRACGEDAVHIGFDADAMIGASSAVWDTFVFNRIYGDEPVEVQVNGTAPGRGRQGGAGQLRLRYGDQTPAKLTYWNIPFAEPVPIVPEMQEIVFWVKTNVPVSIKVPIAPFGFIYHGPAVQPSDQWQELSVGDAYERLKAWCAGGGEDADFGQLPGVILAVHTAPGMQAEILVDDIAVSGQPGIGAAVDQQRRRRRFARVTASVVTLPWSDLGRSLETVLDRLDEAAACGSDIVCLPMECVKTDGQPIPGPISTAIAAKAREHGMYVIGNIRESEGGRTFVTSFLCGRDGELIGKYRKSHKMPDEDMDLGDDLPVFDTDFGPVAMRIGSDRYFADIDHVYTAKGARMIFWSQEFEPLEDEVTQDFVSEGRAQDYNVFIACARYSFDGPGWITNFWPRYRGCPIGRSYVINREGMRIASTTRKGSVATAVIPRGELAGPGRGPNRNPAFRALTEPVQLPEPREWTKRVVRVTAIENHVGIDDLIEKLDVAGRIGSDIVCTYEFVWIRGGPDEQVRKQTEQAHENLRRIREKAKQYGMYVLVGGVIDRLERNEAILVDREGNEAGRYFKIVATHPEQIPGQETPVLETDFGRIGVRICADNAHVEIDRSYGVKGVDILFDLTQDWGPDAIHRNLRNITRAMDAQMFRVEATHSSSEVLHRSHVVEPTGIIVAQSQYMSNGLVSAVIDLDHDRPRRFNRQWRTHEPGGYLPQYQFTEMPQVENDLKETILKQRRPELYQVLAVEGDLAPVAVVSTGQDQLAVLGSASRRLLVIDRASGDLVHPIPLPAEASGIVIRDRTAYVTTNEPAGRLLQIDLDSRRIERSWRVGHMPTAPHVSLDGDTVFLANRFENRVRSVELSTGVQSWVEVIREPVAIALGPGGRHLFVANHLPHVRPFLDDENPTMYAEVSVIDAETMKTVRTIELPNGSQSLRGIALSPDGDYVVVTHVLSHFVLPTMAVAGGVMNRNALSLIRARSLDLLATTILDDPDRGAANPWAVCFTNDGENLLVSHAGTHEISVIRWPALLERAAARSGVSDLFDQDSLTAMSGIRRRIELPLDGPRALCEVGGIVYVAGFFSDNLAALDLRQEPPTVRELGLQQRTSPSLARRGEQYFNDARLCFQQWQSCATCHPDGRADALYWDLLNDGIGNTKNTKSLLMAPLTPPAMSRGVRADAGMAVASGIRHIQFSEPSDEQAQAIEEYLLEMKAVPSPLLNADVLESPKTDAASCAKCHYPGVLRGTLTESARRGKTLFEDKAGCFACHPHPHYTSMQTVDAGLGTGVKYDIPSLVEAWRTAPYLHHGDALSLEETITDYNHLQMRGKTESLTEDELRDLLEYLRSL